jgi:serine/threonine protein kinase
MSVSSIGNYTFARAGEWRLWTLASKWTPDLWRAVRDCCEAQKPSKHPQTVPLRDRAGNVSYFLKSYYRVSSAGAFKDRFRPSKARQALRAGAALAAAHFNAPIGIAAGERRKLGSLRSSFLLTEPVPGMSLPDFLRARYSAGPEPASWPAKRAAMQQLAQEIRRLHDLGFVHGDLVATNIFVAQSDGGALTFTLMDNDRTRVYGRILPNALWKRNLVQLNRLPLPGITLQDRMRFLRAYLGTALQSQSSRSLARWLERKTRQRRWQCDAAQSAGSFRSLMRWRAGAL